MLFVLCGVPAIFVVRVLIFLQSESLMNIVNNIHLFGGAAWCIVYKYLNEIMMTQTGKFSILL